MKIEKKIEKYFSESIINQTEKEEQPENDKNWEVIAHHNRGGIYARVVKANNPNEALRKVKSIFKKEYPQYRFFNFRVEEY